MALEHEQMHQETLLYMIQRLPLARIVRPARPPLYAFGDARRARPIEVDAGSATLGADFDALDFGWDNEFPRITVAVPRFAIDSTPVTNAEFLAFVEAGGYETRRLWTQDDWTWKDAAGLRHPLTWTFRDGVRLPTEAEYHRAAYGEPGGGEAVICSFECTFCRACPETVLGGRCPYCGGELVPRPRRPADKLAKYPPSTERVVKPAGCANARE